MYDACNLTVPATCHGGTFGRKTSAIAPFVRLQHSQHMQWRNQVSKSVGSTTIKFLDFYRVLYKY